MAWRGDSKGHAEAGRKGGKNQGKYNNPGNFANNPQRARDAGRKGGANKPSKKTEPKNLPATEAVPAAPSGPGMGATNNLPGNNQEPTGFPPHSMSLLL